MCEDKIVITSIIQSCVLHWYHAYLLHTVMDRTDATIIQHMYWNGIRESSRKEVTNGDTCQHTKIPNKKYGKFPYLNLKKYHGTNSLQILLVPMS